MVRDRERWEVAACGGERRRYRSNQGEGRQNEETNSQDGEATLEVEAGRRGKMDQLGWPGSPTECSNKWYFGEEEPPCRGVDGPGRLSVRSGFWKTGQRSPDQGPKMAIQSAVDAQIAGDEYD